MIHRILVLALLISCSSVGKNLVQKNWTSSELTKVGSLIVRFESNDRILIKNFTLKLSKKFPTTKYKNVWGGGWPLPFPIETVERDYPVIHNYEFIEKKDIYSKETIEYTLPIGDYYASIDTIENDKLSLEPMVSQLLLFSFGYQNYQHDSYSIKSITHPYDSNCDSEFTGMTKSFTWNVSKCSKIKIQEKKKAFINIHISEPQATRWFIWFSKFLPGILLLAPFTNMEGTYYYREMKVELINPTEDTKE